MLVEVGKGTASGATITIPSGHQVGDLLLIHAFRDGVATAPSLPAGWTSLGTVTTTSTGSRIGKRIATSNAETSGTWTNATEMTVLVVRNQDGLNPTGTGVSSSAVSTTVTYGAVNLLDQGGLSWLVAFAGHRSTDTSLETPPAGMTNDLDLQDGTAEVAMHSLRQTIANWPSTNVSVGGTSSGWCSWVIEIRGAKSTWNIYSGVGAFGSTGVGVTERVR